MKIVMKDIFLKLIFIFTSKNEKVEKLVANLYDKKEYAIHISHIKKAH